MSMAESQNVCKDADLGKAEEECHIGINALLLQNLAGPNALPCGGNLWLRHAQQVAVCQER